MRGHRTFEWAISAIVGVAIVVVFLNRGILFHAATTSDSNPFNAHANSAEIDVAAQKILSQMSLDDKIGQLIIPMSNDTSMNSDMQMLITQYHIGGYFIPEYSTTVDQLHSFATQMQTASKIPMIITTDFEGGGWNTLRAEVGERPSERSIGDTGDPQKAYDKGSTDAKLLRSVGLNLDLAPVVDVLTNPNNTILISGDRTFGNTPDLVTKMASAYIEGMASGGVSACLKHFPGLGASSVDPHKDLPIVDRTLAQLQNIDLVPYQQLIDTNKVSMIMTTHMLISSLDPNLPTSISPAVITDLLRHKMKYDGVVISDAVFMGGLTKTIYSLGLTTDKGTIPTGALLAFEAGTDLLLGLENADEVKATIDLIKRDLASGKITQNFLDDSVVRILRFKLFWKIIPDQFSLGQAVGDQIVSPSIANIGPLNARREESTI
jgi:beta-N-acetylhexosaminidase